MAFAYMATQRSEDLNIDAKAKTFTGGLENLSSEEQSNLETSKFGGHLTKEHLAWRKNAPYLYKILVASSSSWPSLTVQWMPEVSAPGAAGATNSATQQLLTGTRTAGEAPEYIQFIRLDLPSPMIRSMEKYSSKEQVVGGFENQQCNMRIVQRIDHEGEVHRARYMPQNPNVIGAISSTGQISVYDRTKFPNKPCGIFKPTIVLEGHLSGGYGLAWSRLIEGRLATAADDGNVLLWDIRQYNSATGKLAPVKSVCYGDSVNDISWNPFDSATVAVVADTNELSFEDWREQGRRTTPISQPLSVEFHPCNEFLISVGTANGSIHLYDTRNPLTKLHTLETDFGGVAAVRWSMHHNQLLASAHSKNRVCLWDCARLNDDPLRFVHAGHQAAVSDICWNPAIPNMLASVGSDNELHAFQPANTAFI